MRHRLESQAGLDIIEGLVEELFFDADKIVGIRTSSEEYFAKTIIVTTGTFLNGQIHRGKEKINANVLKMKKSRRSAPLSIGAVKEKKRREKK